MGTWGPGPFDNDGAADFLRDARDDPARAIARALERVLALRDHQEVDHGEAGWAACELVALSFGQGTSGHELVQDLLAKLEPHEALRQLALGALPRLADPAISELAGLHQGPDFDAAMQDLGARLQVVVPRAVARPRKGDVLVLPGLLALQVVGPREVAVFLGTFASEQEILEEVGRREARRVPAAVHDLFGRAKLLGNSPVRKELSKKKLYASEPGGLDDYWISNAAGKGGKLASYEEASAHDLHERHDEPALRQVAQGSPARRVRSLDELEVVMRAQRSAQWAARRAVTHPGPFGDPVQLQSLLDWISQTGADNVVRRMVDLAEGRQGYGRPNERSERQPYAFAGLVALWRGGWPPSAWPTTHALPPAPAQLDEAVRAARVLATQIVTRNAELRLMWDAELEPWVSSLRGALS
jgi:hypothetical protein